MSKIKKYIISGFILLNFLAMVRIYLPIDKKFFSLVYTPVDAYLGFFSLYQDWVMFAPEPIRINSKIHAVVEFDDGTEATYNFPKPAGYLDKYMFGEKFRKVTAEGIRKDSNNFLWNDTAKFVLRKLKSQNYSKIPMKVHLVREWEEVPDLEVEFRPHAEVPEKYSQFRFYTYEVL